MDGTINVDADYFKRIHKNKDQQTVFIYVYNHITMVNCSTLLRREKLGRASVLSKLPVNRFFSPT